MARLVDIAEQVLLTIGRPASVREIIDAGKKDGRFKHHLKGSTPHKTLQARISTDIVTQRDRSVFYRYAPAVFGLRREKERGRYDNAYGRVYIGNRRRKMFRHTYIACVNKSDATFLLRQGLTPDNVLPKHILNRLPIVFIDRRDAPLRHDLIKLKTYYYVSSDDLVVRYQKSPYDEKRHDENGTESIGFGSWITEHDLSFFAEGGIDFEGSVLSDFDDLFAFMGERVIDRVKNVQFIGFIYDAVGLDNKDVVGLICNVRLNTRVDFDGKLGVKNLHWISASHRPNYFSQLETWSKYLVDYLANRSVTSR